MSDPEYTKYGTQETQEKLKEKHRIAQRAAPPGDPYPDGKEAIQKGKEAAERLRKGKK